MMMHISEGQAAGDPSEGPMADLFGPHMIDQTIRQAVQYCWMSIPKERRTPEELQQQVRRIVERALRDFKEDREIFQKP